MTLVSLALRRLFTFSFHLHRHLSSQKLYLLPKPMSSPLNNSAYSTFNFLSFLSNPKQWFFENFVTFSEYMNFNEIYWLKGIQEKFIQLRYLNWIYSMDRFFAIIIWQSLHHCQHYRDRVSGSHLLLSRSPLNSTTEFFKPHCASLSSTLWRPVFFDEYFSTIRYVHASTQDQISKLVK